jgi:hypothetical protein
MDVCMLVLHFKTLLNWFISSNSEWLCVIYNMKSFTTCYRPTQIFYFSLIPFGWFAFCLHSWKVIMFSIIFSVGRYFLAAFWCCYSTVFHLIVELSFTLVTSLSFHSGWFFLYYSAVSLCNVDFFLFLSLTISC